MPRANPILTNFTAGELSERLRGRPDIEKYKNACRVLENFTVVPHGGARKRPGTKFVIEPKSATDAIEFIPFIYSTEQAYELMFGPGYIWVLKDQAILTETTKTITGITKANPAVVTVTAHGYSNGDYVYITGVTGMTEVNNRRFLVANVTTDTFELSGVNSSAYTTFSAGTSACGKIVEMTTSYANGDLPNLSYTQTNDVLYLAGGGEAPATITRNSATSFTFADFAYELGPFRTLNALDTLTMVFSSWSGSVTQYGTHIVGETATMTASSGYFTSDMVGALFRIYEPGNASGMAAPPLGDATYAPYDGFQYAYQGNVYGLDNVTSLTGWGAVNRVPSHDKGTVRVYVDVASGTAGTKYFDSVYLHDSSCIVQITGYTSSTVVSVEVVGRNHVPKSVVDSGTPLWAEGAWSTERGYPTLVAFHESRLWFAANMDEPQTIWASRTGAFADFSDGAEDDDALVYTLASGQADTIRWLVGGRVLMAGTAGGEYAITPTSNNEALTPSNVRASMQTTYGSSPARPIAIGNTVLFMQRSGAPGNAGKKLREYSYQFNQDAFQSVDLTIFSEHITGGGLTHLAYQLEPDSIIWGRRSDGQLTGMTYERDQEVVAWYRGVMGGTDAEVVSVGSIPGTKGDDLYICVDRTIGGGTKRYVEVMQQAFDPETDAKEDAWLLDCALQYDGSETSTITGLWHLNGEEVTILNNGAVETQTVSAGAITLDNATTKATVGYGYTGILETMDIEAGAAAGTAQSRKKRIVRVFPYLVSSLFGNLGPDSTTQESMIFRSPDDEMDDTPDLLTDYVEANFPANWDRKAIIRFEHTDPLPFYLASIVAEMETSG